MGRLPASSLPSPATISVLPDIRAAVGPDVEIILDGGVQRGTDIAKGLAMGADGVGVAQSKCPLFRLGWGSPTCTACVQEELRGW